MHLILEAENPSIVIKEKMSIVEQASLGDKTIYNGDAPSDVSDGNYKENIQDIQNIIEEDKNKLEDSVVPPEIVKEANGNEDETHIEKEIADVPVKAIDVMVLDEDDHIEKDITSVPDKAIDNMVLDKDNRIEKKIADVPEKEIDDMALDEDENDIISLERVEMNEELQTDNDIAMTDVNNVKNAEKLESPQPEINNVDACDNNADTLTSDTCEVNNLVLDNSNDECNESHSSNLIQDKEKQKSTCEIVEECITNNEGTSHNNKPEINTIAQVDECENKKLNEESSDCADIVMDENEKQDVELLENYQVDNRVVESKILPKEPEIKQNEEPDVIPIEETKLISTEIVEEPKVSIVEPEISTELPAIVPAEESKNMSSEKSDKITTAEVEPEECKTLSTENSNIDISISNEKTEGPSQETVTEPNDTAESSLSSDSTEPMQCDDELKVITSNSDVTSPTKASIKEAIAEKIEDSSETVIDSIQDEKVKDCDVKSTCKDIPVKDASIEKLEETKTRPKTITDDESIKIIDETKLNEEVKVSSDETSVEPRTESDNIPSTEKTDMVQEASNDSEINEVVDDVEEINIPDEIDKPLENKTTQPSENKKGKESYPVIKLSLDILSDDEEEPPKKAPSPLSVKKVINDSDKETINIDDDDDIMLVDEDTATKTDAKTKKQEQVAPVENAKSETTDVEMCMETDKVKSPIAVTGSTPGTPVTTEPIGKSETTDPQSKPEIKEKPKPVVTENFFKSHKKNLADMTRDELEDFCVLKIVESIMDRTSLTDIRTKLKTLAQNFEEYKKKTMMLTKQNRDLQVVLKSVQEEQKKGGSTPITPLKITRSVGMQVLMTDKMRKKGPAPATIVPTNTRPIRTPQPNKRMPATNQAIPVPRLIPATPAATPATRVTSVQSAPAKTPVKTPTNIPNGLKNVPTSKPEKRPLNKMMTVDLTDDEPPPKVQAGSRAPNPPVRLVSPQNLLTPRAQAATPGTSPRKVYIPIGGPQAIAQPPNVRPGTVLLKGFPGPRPRGQGPMVRLPPSSVRMARVTSGRHPAPLPDIVKQYQPPNWKALPPAPDLKLAKVENGIVISWKIEGYLEDSYEEIASYQLFAYQETSSPPSTTLWKKIGDVKALPLPMACTLTQFMAGHKYYFAVRAVDVKSRLGPFSLPGSILLLNKM